MTTPYRDGDDEDIPLEHQSQHRQRRGFRWNLIVRCPYQLRHIPKKYGGRWESTEKFWVFTDPKAAHHARQEVNAELFNEKRRQRRATRRSKTNAQPQAGE